MWLPGNQKVFEESGSGRKCSEPSPAPSRDQTNQLWRERNHISNFTKWTYLGPIFHEILKGQKKSRWMLYQGIFIFKKHVILWL